MLLDVELPWPPTVNHIWKRGRGVTYKTAKGCQYEAAVSTILMVAKAKPISREKRLAAKIWLWPPDYRRRDIDNVMKALLDSVSRALGFDDAQIDELHIARFNKVKGGKAHIQIKEMPHNQV